MQLPLLSPSSEKQLNRRAPWLAGATLSLCLGAINPVVAQVLPPVTGQLMYATQTVGTTTNLLSFDEAAPSTIRSLFPITGITAGQAIVGMDARPRTGQLFALAYDATQTTDNARLYTINITSGVATPVGASAMTLELGTATAAARVGFDFNPTVDLIRVVSTNKTNYRLNPTSGTVFDSAPNTPGIQRDGDLNTTEPGVVNPSVSAAAYTNNFFGTGSTALYVYDDARNQVFIQTQPNAGVLTAAGPVSGITVNTAADISFDMNSVRSGENLALLAAATGTSTNTQLFEINLSSGAATLRGTIGNGLSVSNVTFATFAVDPVFPPATALTGQLLFAQTGGNLISFDSGNPRVIRSSTPISGVADGQTLVGIDFRPFNRELYTLGYNATVAAPNPNAQLYTINLSTGVLTPVGSAIRLELGTVTDRVGFDFNPEFDRIRVVSTTNTNYRLDPTNGAIAATDGNLNPSGSSVSGVAYTNSVPGALATTTILYDYDATGNRLLRQDPPNAGTLVAVGNSGITVNPAAGVNFDIFFNPNVTGEAQNTGYLVAAPSGSVPLISTLGRLYTVNLTTGAATEVETIGAGMPITGVSALISGTVLSNNKASDKVSAQVEVFPNPATSEVSINLPAALSKQSVEAVLVNTLGQSVLRRTLSARDGSTQRLSLNGVAKGVYMLQLSTAEGVVSKRLMVR